MVFVELIDLIIISKLNGHCVSVLYNFYDTMIMIVIWTGFVHLCVPILVSISVFGPSLVL